MSAQDEVDRLLKEHGAVLVRSKNHLIYKFSDGKIFTVPATPSDYRAWANALHTLRDLLGVKREVKKNPNRKRKKGASKQLYRAEPPVVRRRNPLEGFTFRSLEWKYEGCLPVTVEQVPMTPMWCWMRNLFGYGGKR
jgi:predicted RNA binding protein YcfA (HicA-like mRNA interferase family)